MFSESDRTGIDIIAMPTATRSGNAILAVISGANSWIAIETYAQSKRKWLETFLRLPNGIPSHDTIARVFARLNSQAFEQCFHQWVESITKAIGAQVIPISMLYANKITLYLNIVFSDTYGTLRERTFFGRSHQIALLPLNFSHLYLGKLCRIIYADI